MRTAYSVASEILEQLTYLGFERSTTDSCTLESGAVSVRVSIVTGYLWYKYRVEVLVCSAPVAVFENTSAGVAIENAVSCAKKLVSDPRGSVGWAHDSAYNKHNHYKRDVSTLDYIDVYRIIDLYDLHDPCFQHALKKYSCRAKEDIKT